MTVSDLLPCTERDARRSSAPRGRARAIHPGPTTARAILAGQVARAVHSDRHGSLLGARLLTACETTNRRRSTALAWRRWGWEELRSRSGTAEKGLGREPAMERFGARLLRRGCRPVARLIAYRAHARATRR